MRSFNPKKLSRKKCKELFHFIVNFFRLMLQYALYSNNLLYYLCKGGSLRGRGWTYGSGFVDGIFPVMSPTAQQLLDILQKEVDQNRIWEVLHSLPASHTIWDDIINVAVQLRLNKRWDLIMLVRNQYQYQFILFYFLFVCNVKWYLESKNQIRFGDIMKEFSFSQSKFSCI